MYEIGRSSVREFINDRTIQFPRFQRKQTWDEKKNFQLVISIFKNYPMGVCIISKEKNSGGREARFLLDGRQRRNVFRSMYENPDEICVWARKFLSYSKKVVDPNDFREIFDAKIKEYLENDDEDEGQSVLPEAAAAEEEISEEESFETSGNYDYGTGLDLLFKIVFTFYNRATHYTGFSAPFDFDKWLKDIPYQVSNPSTVYILSGMKLKTFIDEYRNYCYDNRLECDAGYEVFYGFLMTRCKLKVADGLNERAIARAEAKIKAKVQERWEDILLRINLVDEIDKALGKSMIGVIEVSGITSSDSQKIFNIINSAGVKLTAAEVLSASGSWNTRITNPSADFMDSVGKLYQGMDIKVNGAVKWDVPATLLDRLGKNVVFRELSWDSKAKKTEFEKKLTLGFKVFAGLFKKGITKDDIEKLGKDGSIDWNAQCEEVCRDLKNMLHIIGGIPYFGFLSSWNATVMDILSDSIALDFLLVAYFDWDRKNKPMGSGAAVSQFQKNCIILLDRLIYEYINLQWRGSGDSKVAKSIEQVRSSGYPVLFPAVKKSEWTDLLKRIREDLVVSENAPISYLTMKPLLYHAYCLMQMSGSPAESQGYEIDHILPQATFKASAIENAGLIQESLYNLALLPKKENVFKSDDKLKNIDDAWLKSQIVKYEYIPEARFEEFSNVNNYAAMFDLRKADFFDKAFGEKRDDLLNN